MMTNVTPQKRPLVLLHKCSECTTFALAPLATIKYQPQRTAATLQQRVSRLRLSSAPPTITENVYLGNSFDDNSVFEEDESDIDRQQQQQRPQEVASIPADDSGNSTSGLSSLEDSPVSRSDSPSPTSSTASGKTPTSAKASGDDAAKEKGFPPVGRLSKALRHRSVSECEGISNSPIKSILKRPSIVRSLSECANESMMEGASAECLYPNEAYVSESGEDDGDSDQQQSQDQQNVTNDQSPSFKKTVRFNDLVQQTLFRPNSSILGHKKRQERKQQQQQTKMKRKRTTSNSSGGSESKISISENETEPNGIGEDEVDQAARRNGKSAPLSENDQRRHQQKKSALMEGGARYAGFLIGRQPIDQIKHHQRHPSGDSALGDDEGDCETGEGNQRPESGGDKLEVGAAKIQTSDTKDSGIDDES